MPLVFKDDTFHPEFFWIMERYANLPISKDNQNTFIMKKKPQKPQNTKLNQGEFK